MPISTPTNTRYLWKITRRPGYLLPTTENLNTPHHNTLINQPTNKSNLGAELVRGSDHGRLDVCDGDATAQGHGQVELVLE